LFYAADGRRPRQWLISLFFSRRQVLRRLTGFCFTLLMVRRPRQWLISLFFSRRQGLRPLTGFCFTLLMVADLGSG
jgi:hypothetical protein